MYLIISLIHFKLFYFYCFKFLFFLNFFQIFFQKSTLHTLRFRNSLAFGHFVFYSFEKEINRSILLDIDCYLLQYAGESRKKGFTSTLSAWYMYLVLKVKNLKTPLPSAEAASLQETQLPRLEIPVNAL